MKKLIFFMVFFLTLVIPSSVFAQPMPALNEVEGMGNQFNTAPDDHTAREEAEGKEIWEKLQAKQITCSELTDDNFGSLGEYFMGQMIGTSHEAMNNMMERMMGKEGEEQMHVVMGKRLSGCDTSAQFPQSGTGFMPMMNMMGRSSPKMMGDLFGLSFILGLITWILTIIFLVLGTIFFWKKIFKR